MRKTLAAWTIFIRERFHPGLYIPTVFLFVWFNVNVLTETLLTKTNRAFVSMMFIPCLLFFFRLRLFDEIKDYETDLVINPHRPLARGLLSVDQVKKALLILVLIEGTWIFILTKKAFPFYTVAVLYSFLMYKEFYIGSWLRPKLTTYAVTHTWVCTLLSFAIGISALHFQNPNLVLNLESPILDKALLIALMNWLYFNFFEFARKTFATVEEKDSVPSYSQVFGRGGAFILCFSQLAIAYLLWTQVRTETPFLSLIVLFVMVLVGLYNLKKNTADSASLFRMTCGLILLIQYFVLILEIHISPLGG